MADDGARHEPHAVLVSMLFARDTDRVELFLHYLHSSVTGIWNIVPVTAKARDVAHDIVLRRIRPLLDSLAMLTVLQRRLEASAACEAATGMRPRGLKVYVDPVVLHDANTVYTGMVGAMFGGGCWFRGTSECERCGHNEWSMTSTPPRVVRRRLVRDHYQLPVSFCWTCLAQKPASMLELACGWPTPAMPAFVAA